MKLNILKSKIHHGVITQANIDYDGSLSVDSDLMKACNMKPFEKVLVANLVNGNRLETYLIEAPAGSGVICANGAAALLCSVGDAVIVMSFCQLDEDEVDSFEPSIIRLSKTLENKIIGRGIKKAF